MKKILFLLCMFVTLQVSAQEFHFIPKIGLNLSNMTNSGASIKPGVNIGLAGELMLTKHFAIEPGVYYSMQGNKGDVGNYFYSDYINIPIYAKGYVYNGLYIFAGPQFGFNVRSKLNTFSFKDYAKTFDFSLGVGVGYQFAWGMMISANYNIGLTNTFTKDYKNIFGENYKNSVVQINLGWRF